MGKGTFVLGTVIGGASAFAAAYLFAPKPGAEFQAELDEKTEGVREAAKDYWSIAQERGGDIFAILKDAGQEISGSIKQTSEQLSAQMKMDAQILKQDFSRVREDVPGSKETLKSNLKDATTEMKYTARLLKEDITGSAKDALEVSETVVKEAKQEIGEVKTERQAEKQLEDHVVDGTYLEKDSKL